MKRPDGEERARGASAPRRFSVCCRDHGLTIWIAALWLGTLAVSAWVAPDLERWLADVATGHADAAYSALILLFFGRILWLHERGRADKRDVEKPDV